MTETLRQQLIRHEGLRLKPYRCSAGYLTIGVGRKLEGSGGISKHEAMLMLHNDIDKAINEVNSQLIWVRHRLNNARQNVLSNMAFNMGVGDLLGFKRMLKAAHEGDYELAAEEILDSKYALQVGDRAVELAEQMRTGLLREK